jgi:hypothetical protein
MAVNYIELDMIEALHKPETFARSYLWSLFLQLPAVLLLPQLTTAFHHSLRCLPRWLMRSFIGLHGST